MDKSGDNSQKSTATKEVVEEQVAKPKHSSWYRSWRLLNKDQRGALITALFLAVFLPITALAVRSEQLTRGRAADPITPPGPPVDFGQAVRFDGQTGYIQVPVGSAQFPDVNNNFTIEGYYSVKSCSLPNSGGDGQLPRTNSIVTRLPGIDSSISHNGSVGFETISYNPPEYGCGKFGYSFNLVYGNSNFVNSVEPVELNTWRHFAVVRSGGQLMYFNNGVLETTKPVTGELDMTGDYVWIGAGDGNSDLIPDNLYFFDGDLDELRISKIARYSVGFSPPGPLDSDIDTVALYHFDGNANDSSGNNFAGVIMGSVSFVESTVPYFPPSPSPSPFRNSKPKITTASLPSGQLGVFYQASVAATDPDANQNLFMSAVRLPTGLTLGPCAGSNGQPSWISCTVSGTPTTTGTFGSTFTVQDPLGAKSSKKLNIVIQ